MATTLVTPIQNLNRITAPVSADDFVMKTSTNAAALLSYSVLTNSFQPLTEDSYIYVEPQGIGGGSADRDAIEAAFIESTATGKGVFVKPGSLYFSSSVYPVPGTGITLIGAGRDQVTVTAAKNVIPIFVRTTVATQTRLAQDVLIQGFAWDGEQEREVFPYNSPTLNPNYGMGQSFVLRFEQNSFCNVTIRDNAFINNATLPFWIAEANGSVIIENNIFSKTKDPGILFNNSVLINNNVVEYSSDNAFSVSRSNKRVVITNNTVFGCLGSIFVGGTDRTGNVAISMTLSGASYATASTLTLTASSAPVATPPFTTEDIGYFISVRSGVDICVVQIISIESGTSATVINLNAVPAPLQNTPTTNWSNGPFGGVNDFVIANNVSKCSGSHGIFGNLGSSRGTITGNQIQAAGFTLDSEVTCFGTVAIFSTTFNNVTNASAFDIGDFVVCIPQNTMQDMFISEVTGVGATTITVAEAAPNTLANVQMFRAGSQSAVFGITFVGDFETTQILSWAENLHIDGNTIVDCTQGGIRLGSTSGSARRCTVSGNRIYYDSPRTAISNVSGVLITELSADMRTSRIRVFDNEFTMPTGVGLNSFTVRYNPVDTSSSSYISIGPNREYESDNSVAVVEQTGGTNITESYNVQVLGSLNATSLISVNTLGPDAEYVSTYTSTSPTLTSLTLGGLMNVYTGVANVSITDVVVSNAGTLKNLMVLRNASMTSNITLEHDNNKLRCPGGVNYVVSLGCATVLMRPNTSLVQVIGSRV